MSSTNKTTNLGLSQFLGTDKPAWLGDYNSDMQKIDDAFANLEQGGQSSAADIAALQQKDEELTQNINDVNDRVDTVTADIITVGNRTTVLEGNYDTMHHEVVLLDTEVKVHEEFISKIGTMLTVMQDVDITVPVNSITEICRITGIPAGTYIALATVRIPIGYSGMIRMSIGTNNSPLGRLTGTALQISESQHTQFPEALRIFTLNGTEDALLNVLQISADSSDVGISGGLRLIRIA